ncbi:C40 family peptidase [Macrococcus sp. DPC7161]|uniref:C40 family peptidase n=1 Tax=Macrococcus sp. DPC7161 TaxID=2507060 RepID=UPI00100BBDB0|nr:C40 family peptidase [Macrococcus sp. DPC7161]RXK18406.1 NlpC/P60 family protein [Macrococcus sp. DPC7161]
MQKVCSVAVGTIWSHPDKARDIDELALSNPVNIQKWLLCLNLEEKQSFCEELRIDTQVLYGERVEVIEEIGEWSKVVCIDQPSKKHELGYPGFIKTNQLSDKNVRGFSKYVRIIAPKALAYRVNEDQFDKQFTQPLMPLSFNTVLPYLSTEEASNINHFEQHYIVDSPHGKLRINANDCVIQADMVTGRDDRFSKLYDAAKQYIDLGYLWGGMSSYGYDCSGFVYQMYRHVGYTLPRDADEQYQSTMKVEKKDLIPGDLVFFSNEKDIEKISHVGIYIGSGMMIHSPNTPKSIEEVTIDSGYYNDTYVGGSRVYESLTHQLRET